ncbi:MAG: hypothetical protein HN964_02285 [Candidatus Jacksonbacteria bacterium]|nr:hypothetical protein [Candidatus Jacksonbacteria bacterium]MBT7008269.1 hypothetical protein [Candidatus Jacksonbacteria bacterium]
MLDTVILKIPEGYYTVMDKQKFTPHYSNLENSTGSFMKATNNTQKEKCRITAEKRTLRSGKLETTLKLEFSVPKLLYGNNLQEIDENHIELIIDKLSETLRNADVLIFSNLLEKAPVSSFHVGKNITLSDGYTSSFVINELSKIDMTKKLDLTKTTFMNGGQSLQYYSGSHSMVFYDKVADMMKPPARAIDKSLPREIPWNFNKNAEILRMEVRLCNKRKMNSVLKKIGQQEDPIFRDLFSQNLWQDVLMYYWKTLINERNLFIFDLSDSPTSLLMRIKRANPKIKQKQALSLLSLNLLIKEKGARATRDRLEELFPSLVWSRIKQDLKLFDHPEFNNLNHLHGFISDIEKAIFNKTVTPLFVKKSKVQYIYD